MRKKVKNAIGSAVCIPHYTPESEAHESIQLLLVVNICLNKLLPFLRGDYQYTLLRP